MKSTLDHYVGIAEFRSSLRRFLARTEEIAPRHGLTPRQYDLLAMIKGAPGGGETSTVGDLAPRMHLGQSTVTELVARAVKAGLVERRPSPDDGRVVVLRVTREGERRLRAAADELGPERRHLARTLAELDGARPRRR